MDQQPERVRQSSSFKWVSKLRDYKLLIKFNLSFMVVFSAVISFLLAPKVTAYDLRAILWLAVGGMLVTGSANAINQVLEKDSDRLMQRTSNRPVAAGRMQPREAWAFALVAGILGSAMLWHFNFLACALSLLSLFVYGFIYTPLKKVNAISVLVGAVPGSLPCLIGWAAGNDDLSAGGWVLFALQFFWQFPHFWAIAWIAHGDYTKAGFKLMPSNQGPTKYSAIQSVIYSLFLLPVGILPYLVGISGLVSVWVIAAANLVMIGLCIRLLRRMNKSAARGVMFGSYIYLPIVLLALLADKIHG